jgi:hypothetical protein
VTFYIGKLNPQRRQKDPDAYWEIGIGYKVNLEIIRNYPEVPDSGFPIMLKIHTTEYQAALHSFHDEKRYSSSYIGKPEDEDKYYMKKRLSAFGLAIVGAKVELEFNGSTVKIIQARLSQNGSWIKI